MTRLSSFRRDRRGVAAVEFALIALPMFTMICGTIELGHMIYCRAVLEGAVTQAARTASATMETTEGDRQKIMLDDIKSSMSPFRTAKDKEITIETKVYKDFSTAYPENFTDTNGNGSYDFGEDYTDRNGNGKWDPAQPISGTMGGPGDVVSYTAKFPKQILFDFVAAPLGLGSQIDLAATTVTRNETIRRKVAL